VIEELEKYIKDNLTNGVSQDQISQNLVASGWKQADIDAAFLQLNVPQGSLPPFPVKPPAKQDPHLKAKEQKSFLNLKILILLVIIAVLLITGSTSCFLLIKKAGLPIDNKVTETIENLTGFGDLKKCNDVTQENIKEQETTLSAKFILSETDQISKKVTFKLLDFNTKHESILNVQSLLFNDLHFSPDGKYLIYKQRLESPPSLNSKNNLDIIKFFLFNTETETTTEIIPSFKIDLVGMTNVIWSGDSSQFMIRQDDDKTRKPENAQASYFNVEDLKAHDMKELISSSGTQGLTPYQFPRQNELIFSSFKQDGESVKYKIVKADLSHGSLKIIKTFSIKSGIGVFSPNLKYYVFVEKETYVPSMYKESLEGKSEEEQKQIITEDYSAEIPTYIGYIDIDNNCTKKIQITEVPIYYGNKVEIKEFSEDSKQVLVEIESKNFSSNTSIRQNWKLDIATLTKLSKGINTTINGEQITNVGKISSLFNYAIVRTSTDKKYIMNLKTEETTIIPIESGKYEIMASWLKETVK